MAKQRFQLHGTRADGSVAFRKQVSRGRVLSELSSHGCSVVAMEACAGAHYWGREVSALGHDVRLVPPVYVKPFVKRRKSDAADAEAICEAASRPTMRFVEVKSAAQQSHGVVFRTQDLLVRQRTQTIDALRGHLAEFGIVAPRGPAHVGKLAQAVEAEGSGLPAAVRTVCGVLLKTLSVYDGEIKEIEKEMRAQVRACAETARPMSIPGIGPVSAMAFQAFAPPMEGFRRGRDFAAWLGLVPRQHGTGGKMRLGKVSKMGQRDLRRLLVSGAMTVIRHAIRRGSGKAPWLTRMLARKPRMRVATALANRMARMARAVATKKEFHRVPATVARRGGRSRDGVGGAGKPEERVRANGHRDGIGKPSFVIAPSSARE